jgi:hypothetical protein
MKAQDFISIDRHTHPIIRSRYGFMYSLIIFLFRGPDALKGGRNTSPKPVGSALPIFAGACLGFQD